MPEHLASTPEEHAEHAEWRRRRREAWIIAVTAIAVLLLAIFQAGIPEYSGGGSLGTDAVLVLLINLNVILLALLVFLVGRNIVKLVLDRRRRIMGARLRTRLVVAFVAIALFPATLLFSVAQVFVSNSIERWFDGRVEQALEGSLDVAHAYYDDLGRTAGGFATRLAEQIAAAGLADAGKRPALRALLEQRLGEYQLDVVEVFADGKLLAHRRRARLPAQVWSTPWSEVVRRAAAGEKARMLDQVGPADLVRAARPIRAGGDILGVVVVGAWVPTSVVHQREELSRSWAEYLSLKFQRRPIRTAYTITLVLVTLVVLFAATWVGFYVARGLTVPIERLAEGSRAVAQGNLDLVIPGEGRDEIGTLVKAFNGMTADLKRSRTELDARRRDLEIVLAHITAGVIATDATGRIMTMNAAAADLLGVEASACIGWPVPHALADDRFATVQELVAMLLAPPIVGRGPQVVERQLALEREGRETSLLLTGAPLTSESAERQGVVLFVEDLTHLLRVERMEAWREVARRIAHEIKNPLTPIQLAAQRLRRRYGAQLRENGAVFEECTRTIIQQVDELKALVNEFAMFARMPTAEHTPQDVNRLLEETLVLLREGHPQIVFEFSPAPSLPNVDLDREGVKRAIINLLDNAVAACAARTDRAVGERGRIEIKTEHVAGLGVVRLEIADDGIGMPSEVKARVFEPYFSTKRDGTGLGLAIVSAIVADHRGFVRVRDNVPQGSRFVVEFPVRERVSLVAGVRLGAFGRA